VLKFEREKGEKNLLKKAFLSAGLRKAFAGCKQLFLGARRARNNDLND
jgi:hypothetical protein